jgi:hypothetical protein
LKDEIKPNKTFIKGVRNKKIKIKLKNMIFGKLELNYEIKNKLNFYKKSQEQKLKKIKTKVIISTTKMIKL